MLNLIVLWRCLLSIVRRVSSVSTITTRKNEAIKSIFSANVYHVPGLCLLGIGGAPYISHKIMARKPYFHIFEDCLNLFHPSLFKLW